jgi:ATPase subunit of ABC transporter with duplicated ATPase domains
MISLSLNNITLVLGAKTIFEDLTSQIGEDQKIGLIGPNGAGKSTLFKVIMGEYAPEPGGTVVRSKGILVGYLAQEPALDAALTALEAALAGSERMVQVTSELESIEARLGIQQV